MLVKRSDLAGSGRRLQMGRWIFALSLGLSLTATLRADVARDTSPARSEPAIQKLIEQLGSSEFALRQKAHDEIARLGILAFDALQDAQRHTDAEVRKQAEYLLRAVRVVWVRDDDPESVRQILRNYRLEDAEQREICFRELGLLPHDQGLPALCRLARFETSEDLARLAALYAMQPQQSRGLMRGARTMREEIEEAVYGTPSADTLALAESRPPRTVEARQQLAAQIREVVGDSRRTSVVWLQAYADHLSDPASATETWQKLTDAGEEELRLHPDPLRRRIFKEFLRWQVETLPASPTDAQAKALMERLVEYHEEAREELLITCHWLLRRQAWPLVEILVRRFPKPFESDPHLMYRYAEALEKQGDGEGAEQLVRKVLRIEPDLENQFLHVELGMDLQSRGLFPWAEREYRSVISQPDPNEPSDDQPDEGPADGDDAKKPERPSVPAPPDPVASHPPVEAMIRLGFMFHDMGRDQDAYEAFKMLIDWMDRDKTVVRLAQELGRVPLQIRSQMHYSHAMALSQAKSYNEQREQLKKALEYDRSNADILIAMYRIPDADEAWKDETKKLIDQLRDYYRTQIANLDRNRHALTSREDVRNLAMQLNQYAWLVANTYGDFPDALASSQRSLELSPNNAGYLDTLARCHYALGQLEDAIRNQRRAVAIEPHSGLIRRQLDLFEAELAQRKS